MAGFASARPSPAPEPQLPTAPSIAVDLGSEAGFVAARAISLRSPIIPPNSSRWRDLVSDHFAPQDVTLALRVIHCESSGRPDAVNNESGAAGLFQHLPSYWEERTEAAAVAGSAFDAESNIAVAAWLVYRGGGWRHWNESRPCWSDGSPLQ